MRQRVLARSALGLGQGFDSLCIKPTALLLMRGLFSCPHTYRAPSFWASLFEVPRVSLKCSAHGKDHVRANQSVASALAVLGSTA